MTHSRTYLKAKVRRNHYRQKEIVEISLMMAVVSLLFVFCGLFHVEAKLRIAIVAIMCIPAIVIALALFRLFFAFNTEISPRPQIPFACRHWAFFAGFGVLQFLALVVLGLSLRYNGSWFELADIIDSFVATAMTVVVFNIIIWQKIRNYYIPL